MIGLHGAVRFGKVLDRFVGCLALKFVKDGHLEAVAGYQGQCLWMKIVGGPHHGSGRGQGDILFAGPPCLRQIIGHTGISDILMESLETQGYLAIFFQGTECF
eukprot:scaffold25768_cov50-Attheya_sp.AAC.2